MLKFIWVLLVVFAGAGSAQDIDTRLKLDQIKAGSYVIYAMYTAARPDDAWYETHVYAGRRGDLYRVQIYDGRFPDGELVRTDFLNENGELVSELHLLQVVTWQVGPVARFLGPVWGRMSGRGPRIIVSGENVYAVGQRRGSRHWHHHMPHNCRREIGECFFNDGGEAIVQIINTPVGDGYAWEEYRKLGDDPERRVASGYIELDEMGVIRRERTIYPGGVERVMEQVEAVYW